MTFYENFIRLCNAHGKTPSAAAIEAGIAKSAVNRWKNGGGITDPAAVKLADYFGVSLSELKGDMSYVGMVQKIAEETGSPAAAILDNDPENKKTAGQMADGLRGTGYELLTPENKEVIDALIEKLLKLQSHE